MRAPISSHWLCRASSFHPVKDARLKLGFDITKHSARTAYGIATPAVPRVGLSPGAFHPSHSAALWTLSRHWSKLGKNTTIFKAKLFSSSRFTKQPNNCIGLPERSAHNSEIKKVGGGRAGRNWWSCHCLCSVHALAEVPWAASAPIRCRQENQWDQWKEHHWIWRVLDK